MTAYDKRNRQNDQTLALLPSILYSIADGNRSRKRLNCLFLSGIAHMNPTTMHLLSAGQISPNPRWYMAPHEHAFHEFVVVLQGTMHVKTLQRAVAVRTNDVLFYARGTAHEERSEASDPVWTCFIGFTWEEAAPDLPMLAHDPQGRIQWLIHWLFEEREAVDEMSIIMQQSAAQSALAAFLRVASYREPDMVARIRQYMRVHLTEHLDIQLLADEARMSKYHFIRVYRKLSGRTPMDDLRRLRAEAARDLLLTTHLPLKSIAPRVGAANEYHLARLIRHYYGMPPGAIRKRITWKNGADDT